MLEAIDITKQFKKKKVVDGLNMYIESGETVGLLGPNGAGKSTTISMISSLVPPTSGDVRFHKQSILKNPQELRRVLGVVPQEIALYNDLTAKENLLFFGRIHHMSGKQLQKKVDEVLELIGLSEQKKVITKHFSGGMKRRLNIGASLMHDPEMIIMDEPTVGIDPQSRNHILETVKRLNQEIGMSILYTSHYMEEVEFICDRIYIMDQGRIIAAGTKDEIKSILSAEKTLIIKVEQPNEKFVQSIRQEAIVKEVQSSGNMITIVIPKEVNLFARLFQLAEGTETTIQSIEAQTPTLEDVFLHLTGRALRN
ncbi:ABC transporter ATP-binding protein [Cytobacillus dafuensis]|uniref:ABC transporter ATP-binding protein n=1 Tax=Cytobacillus dafuensis TaxID=1742359 RepID=A0A5B8Z4J8_CYTDA|nr:ABC transporter ATP-binding protein [Cytobacillus dafuensis]QED46236.1 ABC transporter ATP-binding protein [Cytobacillus dafuensis]